MANAISDGFVVSQDGVRVAYRDHGGSGRGLVLLHGGGANLVSMDQYAARLGQGRRAVAVEVRSCGQSGDPDHFRLADTACDVAAVIEALRLGPVDVVGHSLGGFVAGYYASAHPGTRIVSIDGFGPGMVTVGSDDERAAFKAYQNAMREDFMAMTAPPEVGDRAWRDGQVEALCGIFPRIGYTAPNARAMAERNFVDLGNGMFRRHPSRQLFADAFADDGDKDILRMYRNLRGPALIIRCTEFGAPGVLDTELKALVASNPYVEVIHLPVTHLAPAWDALEAVAALVEAFFARSVPGDHEHS